MAKDKTTFLGVFQSTPSARRATHYRQDSRPGRSISIHALREESDRRKALQAIVDQLFQSTPSARRATPVVRTRPQSAAFQSTPSARRATKVSGGHA